MAEGAYQYAERWVVIGDLTNSTEFLFNLDNKLNGEPQGTAISKYSSMIESIYGLAERMLPSGAILANTMGDGFLLLGSQGHGSGHIRYDFPHVLEMCRIIKDRADEILRKGIEDIQSRCGSVSPVPLIHLKLCLSFGTVMTTVGHGRHVGDCLNFASRVLSAEQKNVFQHGFAVTEKYRSEILTDAFKETVAKGNYLTEITVKDFPKKGEKKTETITAFPVQDSPLSSLAQAYLKTRRSDKDIGGLADMCNSKANIAEK